MARQGLFKRCYRIHIDIFYVLADRFSVADKLCETLLQFFPDRIVFAFDHLEVQKSSLNNTLHTWGGRRMILLRHIMLYKTGKGLFVAIPFEYIKEVVKTSDIISGNVNAVADNQSGYFLPASRFLETSFFLIKEEILFLDYTLKLLAKITIFLINIVITTKCNVIGISGI